MHLTIVSTITVPNPGETSTSHFDGKLVSVDELRGKLLVVDQGQPADPVVVDFHRE